ncbi:hypothetical protein LVB87_14250 [Lysobacter sp. KIS68-7]|uniref:hypothetical protein n=1 Tax=Lysobacter sp. KIS68-7 TaxID=2904252 RepID=UPI001E571C7E|nr:hypothetical protein [Lysobacter sp. KIS68-7]UHQ19328.1 hypothetical protein LVB87_14250 [Lysobacter sp. KIS68-7]
MTRTLLLVAALGAALVPELASAKEKHAAAAAPASDKSIIDSAMRAAPAKVSAGAKIVAFDDKGQMRTVREGSNGFTCMADNPETPGPDPMCVDAAAMDWAGAWMSKKDPTAGKVGLAYMLEGGTDASNTDPYAKAPTKENHWIKTGPHVMVVGAEPAFYDQYPKSPDPDTSMPYVMWAGTPYQHLMVPTH